MTVNLTRIYTRLGDGGDTHLGDMSRVAKTHPRIEAYGTVDELNAQLGVVLTLPDLPAAYREWLKRIQNDLFDVGADISVPASPDARERLRVLAEPRRRGSRPAATRSTRTWRRCARSCCRAGRRRPRSCTWLERSAGGPSDVRSPAATTSAQR